MTARLDLTGQRFGRLIAIDRAPNIKDNGGSWTAWLCKCECGAVVTVRTGCLRRGDTQSCGCLRSEIITKHGGSASPEYWVWHAMHQRCENPKHESYRNYGARGITVCERWREFADFIADMGPRPSPGHSIDRLDNDGPYEPGNCQWATKPEQGRNRRPAKVGASGIVGVYWFKPSRKWMASIKHNGRAVHLGYFDDIDAAANARRNAESRLWEKARA